MNRTIKYTYFTIKQLEICFALSSSYLSDKDGCCRIWASRAVLQLLKHTHNNSLRERKKKKLFRNSNKVHTHKKKRKISFVCLSIYLTLHLLLSLKLIWLVFIFSSVISFLNFANEMLCLSIFNCLRILIKAVDAYVLPRYS